MAKSNLKAKVMQPNSCRPKEGGWVLKKVQELAGGPVLSLRNHKLGSHIRILVRELDPTCCNMWLIHVDVWQKPAQYCKSINLSIKNFKKE